MTIHWNDGTWSTFSTATIVNAKPNGTLVLVSIGPVTDGLFKGNQIELVITLLATDLLGCYTNEGLTESSGAQVRRDGSYSVRDRAERMRRAHGDPQVLPGDPQDLRDALQVVHTGPQVLPSDPYVLLDILQSSRCEPEGMPDDPQVLHDGPPVVPGEP